MFINRVAATVLFVEDVAKVAAFYRDQLGLEVALNDPQAVAFKMNGQDFLILDMGNAVGMVNVKREDFEAQSGKTDRIMLCADVENVDEAYETLKARGVVFTLAPVDQPWGYRTTYFHDPEGNIWELRQTIPPAASE